MTRYLVPSRVSRVLIVDDVAMNRDLLRAYIEAMDHEVVEAEDGVTALESVIQQEPDLILLDVRMPRMDGVAVCRALKTHPRHRLIPVVLVTATEDRKVRLAGLEAGADDFLTKPVDREEIRARTRSLLRDRRLNLGLDAADSVILALARTVEARDLYTVHHAERVGLYARELGAAYGMTDPEDLSALYHGGVLHDLGKIVIPTEILLKSGELDEQEWQIMRRHVAAGERICQPLRSVAHYLPIIRHHHERLDGGGYPDRLAGTDIPLGARIAAVADTWDAMVSDRPYRRGLSFDEARQRMLVAAGPQLDPGIVSLLLDLLDRGVLADLAAAAGAESAVGAA